MPVIDADAHVVESDETWTYLSRDERQHRPYLVTPPTAERQYWLIDGKIRGLGNRQLTPEALATLSARVGRNMMTPKESQGMADVDARLMHMSRLGIDVQVLLPTIFIEQVTDRPEVELALCRAYNRWLAAIWRRGRGRLRWVLVPPLLTIDEALCEARTAKDLGACGIFMRGIEGERLPSDPYFFPLYAEAVRLDLPIIFHIGNANPRECELLGRYNPGASFWRYRSALLGAFHALVMAGIPARFPELRFGFLEAGAQWIPFVLADLQRRLARDGHAASPELLRELRMYVACETSDDLPYLMRFMGEQRIVIGTDYGHLDTSSDLDAIQTLRGRVDLTAADKQRILEKTPAELYGL